jgi:general secretion pathway protein K
VTSIVSYYIIAHKHTGKLTMKDAECNIPGKRSRVQRSEGGIALMLVLWVLALLSIIVFEFCYTMRIEATITKNFKDGERSYYLAQAGINRTFIELIKTQRSTKKFKGAKDSLVDDLEEDEFEDEETEEWKPREQPYIFELEDGECEVTIGDEGGKINLNWIAKKAKSDRKLLSDIIEKSCGLEGEERDIVVDSIIDWVDKDHNHLMNGAEDEYYESLEEPYEARDGDFVIPEELLLVRGITDDLFYGSPYLSEEGDLDWDDEEKSAFDFSAPEDAEGRPMRTKGLSELFTTFSSSRSFKVNVNDASYGLLMSIPGMTEDVTEMIIELRREEEFENIRDARLMSLPNYNQISSFITVDPTMLYRIEARGKVSSSSVGRSIIAVVEITPRKTDKYTILYWQEGV